MQDTARACRLRRSIQHMFESIVGAIKPNREGQAVTSSLVWVMRSVTYLFSCQMSMEGVRVLAKALEENASRGISHVYVHNEGRIDALARYRGDAVNAADTKVTIADMF